MDAALTPGGSQIRAHEPLPEHEVVLFLRPSRSRTHPHTDLSLHPCDPAKTSDNRGQASLGSKPAWGPWILEPAPLPKTVLPWKCASHLSFPLGKRQEGRRQDCAEL